jgi:hypothetical protein
MDHCVAEKVKKDGIVIVTKVVPSEEFPVHLGPKFPLCNVTTDVFPFRAGHKLFFIGFHHTTFKNENLMEKFIFSLSLLLQSLNSIIEIWRRNILSRSR